MNWLRDIAYSVGIAATSPFWVWRLLRTGKWRTDWKQRFGHPPESPPPVVSPANAGTNDGLPTVLIHAVSVGEVNAIRQLVEQLASDEANPCRVVICATTNSGIARARSLFEPAHRVVRYPFDFSRSVNRFLNAVQPDVVILIELEVWPTFVNCCATRGIPVAVVNGRLSERSFKRYKLIRGLVRGAFAKLAAAAVQTEQYAEHFRAMGCEADRVTVTDTMKWDTAIIEEPGEVAGSEALATAMGIDRSKPLVVAGSTGPGEEALLLANKPSDVQLLIAPRKPERFEEVSQLIKAHTGCDVVRRTNCPGSGSQTFDANPEPRPSGSGQGDPTSGKADVIGDGVDAARPTLPHGRGSVLAQTDKSVGADVFLLDTIGELRKAYALADAVIVGRSLIDLYGSDPIEPIALGKPTVIGPRHGDFRDIVDALLADNGIVVSDQPWQAIRAILDDPTHAKSLGEAGRQTIRERMGATRKHAELVRALMKKSL